MQIIGHNFTKILGFKENGFGRVNVNVDFQFTDLEKQKNDLLKDKEAIRVVFKHITNYEEADSKSQKSKSNPGQLSFEGSVILSASPEEVKEVMKSWKKQELPKKLQVLLSNFLLRKCAPLALQMQADLNLPSHIRIPTLSVSND